MTNEVIIWEAMLDDIYSCKVVRVSEHIGKLSVINTESSVACLTEDVTLAYGAIFGPDADDVFVWQDMCVKAVDNYGKSSS